MSRDPRDANEKPYKDSFKQLDRNRGIGMGAGMLAGTGLAMAHLVTHPQHHQDAPKLLIGGLLGGEIAGGVAGHFLTDKNVRQRAGVYQTRQRQKVREFFGGDRKTKDNKDGSMSMVKKAYAELTDVEKAREEGRKSSKRRHLVAGALLGAATAPVAFHAALAKHSKIVDEANAQAENFRRGMAAKTDAVNRAKAEIDKASKEHTDVLRAYRLAEARKNFDKRHRKFKWRSTDGMHTVKPVWGISDTKRLLTGSKGK